jgi:hypothetical protein
MIRRTYEGSGLVDDDLDLFFLMVAILSIELRINTILILHHT